MIHTAASAEIVLRRRADHQTEEPMSASMAAEPFNVGELAIFHHSAGAQSGGLGIAGRTVEVCRCGILRQVSTNSMDDSFPSWLPDRRISAVSSRTSGEQASCMGGCGSSTTSPWYAAGFLQQAMAGTLVRLALYAVLRSDCLAVTQARTLVVPDMEGAVCRPKILFLTRELR